VPKTNSRNTRKWHNTGIINPLFDGLILTPKYMHVHPPYFPSGTLTSTQAISRRYNEVCQPGYNFDSGGFSGGTGHFTQVVWKESTELGIGRAETQQSGMKCAYIVGRYRPAGNMMGDFANNVVKGRFDASSYCSSVSNPGWKKKFLDKQGRAMATILTKDSEHAQRVSTGSAEFRKQRLEVLKKKKTTVAKKT